MEPKAKYLKDVAKAAGVAPITLRRWLLGGKIPEVSRDRNGWRLFTAAQESAVLRYAIKVSPPGRGGKRR
jgi:DNA (cytosine-5)-methyltransferase 1